MSRSFTSTGIPLLLALVLPAGGAQSADVSAGRTRAAVCFACHGESGISSVVGTPHLAGQDRRYLESALKDYRAGMQRQNPTMVAMAKVLSDADITNIAAYFNLQARSADGRSAAEIVAEHERIRPVGAVHTAVPRGSQAPATSADAADAAAASAAPRSGGAVYAAHCAACHDSGAAGAPKAGDPLAWAPRLAQGTTALERHALEGLNAMPPRGACASCSDDEVKSAVAFLTSKTR